MNCGLKKLWTLSVALLLAALSLQTLHADEDFDAAFGPSKLPWYNPEADKLITPKAPVCGTSGVSERNRIPLLQQKKKGQQIIKPAPAAAAPAATGGNGAFGTIGTGIIYTVAGLLAAVLFGLLIYGFLKLESDAGEGGAESERKKRRIKDHIKHLPFEIEEHEGDFESFAQKAYREGDYSKAVIYLFADLLVAMNDADVVRLQRGKTNRQYLNDIWDYGDIRPYYRKVMTGFEDAFFGKHEIEKSRAEEFFTERPAFDAAVEKIRQRKFAASQNDPTTPGVRVEVIT